MGYHHLPQQGTEAPEVFSWGFPDCQTNCMSHSKWYSCCRDVTGGVTAQLCHIPPRAPQGAAPPTVLCCLAHSFLPSTLWGRSTGEKSACQVCSQLCWGQKRAIKEPTEGRATPAAAPASFDVLCRRMPSVVKGFTEPRNGLSGKDLIDYLIPRAPSTRVKLAICPLLQHSVMQIRVKSFLLRGPAPFPCEADPSSHSAVLFPLNPKCKPGAKFPLLPVQKGLSRDRKAAGPT